MYFDKKQNKENPEVEFQSSLGQQLWNECAIKSQQMVDNFFAYDQPQLSGAASLVTLINAINVRTKVLSFFINSSRMALFS